MSAPRRPVLALGLALLTAGLAFGHGHRSASAGFEVVAHVDPQDGYAADVWGHRGHAYLSSHRGKDSCPARGVRIYSLARPSRPTLVGRFGDWSTPGAARNLDRKTIVKQVETARFSGDLAVTSVWSLPTRLRRLPSLRCTT